MPRSPAAVLLALAAAFLTSAAVPAAAEPASRILSVDRFAMRIGDAGEWRKVELWTVPANPGDVVWLRATVEVPPALRRASQPLGVYYAAMASHEIWWDGELLGRGGRVGRSPAEEIPGPVEALYQVPDHLAAPGPHELLLRTSAFHRHFTPFVGYWNVLVGDYEHLVLMRRAGGWLALVALSGLVLTAVFALALFLFTRERASLLLALLALTASALLVAEAWRPMFGYTYDRHIVRLAAVLALSWLTGVQLVAFVATRFPARGGRWLLAAAAMAATVAPFFPRGWDTRSILVHMVCFTAALGWALAAASRRVHGAWPAVVGLLVPLAALLLRPLGFLDYTLYFSLDFLFLCLLGSHALEVRRERAARAAAELKSARLELEVLRRHLQPHFLMNTLTALSEWVEREPRTAVRMIDSLADELRLLFDLSGRRLVRADEELRLCRSHLEVMSLRRDVSYELEVEGVRGDEAVPPAVLHTLVENAVTHGPAAARVRLRLAAMPEGRHRRFVLESPVDGHAGSGATPGTGTRYVEARLREAWGEEWSFRQGRHGDGWRAELVVPAVETPR